MNRPSKLKITDLLVGSDIYPHPANPSAYFYHKSLHQSICLYEVDDEYTMDLDFILKAVKAATVRYVDEVWGNFRFVEGTKTFDNVRTSRNVEMKRNLYNLHKKDLSLYQKLVLELKTIYFRNPILSSLRTMKRAVG